MSNFEIAIDHWLAREHGDAISRATLGQVELRSGDRSLTLLEDRFARTNRTFANLSAYDLALWFASNWWRLLWEPERSGSDWRMAHSLAAIGGGYVWPNVTVLGDGEQVQIQARPTGSRKWEPIRYLESLDCFLSPQEFEGAIGSLVERVLARLASCSISGTDLQLIWQELKAERSDAKTASIRKLEALLGFDAAAAPEALLDELLSNAHREGRTAVDEVVAEFRSDAGQVLRQVDEGLECYGAALDYTHINELSKRREAWSLPEPPWKRAAVAAKMAREIWNLDRRPLESHELVGLVQARVGLITEDSSTQPPMSAAKWTSPSRRTSSVILRSRRKEGRRFELCRLIAEGLIAPEGERLMPATHAKTSRQKFQRAFAQELLCPFDALLERFDSLPPEDDDIESAAQYFEVSPLVVKSTLANKNILPRF